MHWDSDLTQGGRQALSGNPRLAAYICCLALFERYIMIVAVWSTQRLFCVRAKVVSLGIEGTI